MAGPARVDDRTGAARPGQVVEAELGPHVGGRGQGAAVERDAGRVGHPSEPVERPHRQAGLEQSGGSDGGEDGPAGRRQVGVVTMGGGGEVEEDPAVRDPDAAFERRAHGDRDAECCAARTEQRRVARRSIEALLEQ